MSKELEALNKIQHDFGQLKGQELVNCYEVIEKSLKALEIIKEKNVDIRRIEVCYTVKDYNKGRDEHLNYELTEEEYETIKEVLE